MANYLTKTKHDEMMALIKEGYSVRYIVRATLIAKNTVRGHRNNYLRQNNLLCQCGKSIKHKGWCWYRLGKSPERQKIVRNWYTEKCVDCGGPRYYGSGMRCRKCFAIKADAARKAKLEAKRACYICGKEALIWRDGKPWRHCGSEWCERLYTFYYVEGRNRPPTVRGGKNNGLRFEYFLSDYIKRYSNEQTRT